MSQLDCAMVDTVLYERPDPLLAPEGWPLYSTEANLFS
jgi:hypothetical protein